MIEKIIEKIINDKDKEINDLQQRIDKAIAFIEEETRPEYRNGRDNEFYLELNQNELKELLEILKGDKK